MNLASKSARAVADVTAGMILAFVEIAAPPERVFRALTTEEITEWWGSPEEYRTTSFTADLRPGGRWRTGGIGADGSEFAVEGVYREVDPPRRLVQTWVAPWDGGNETTITYTLEPIEGGTRVTVKHEGFGERQDSCRSHGNGWERVLGWLAKFFPARTPSRFFFLRLVAPRPTFQVDMTDEERDVMRRHAGYWAGLLHQGVAVVFGAVADPAGGWGAGVVRVPDEAAMNDLCARDPAITSNKGFSYQARAMLTAVYRV
jgi:uncharacterized protein YndB with AHSA1/START domain